ncbi:hypothetical protein [Nocardia huaxiensis]|uniref:DUF320 domain-containing protein n=1 Tax=Nocardia huaxiensis TaxID=2755382 RepID=A0A7D6VD32_9NOCA|nr:hypothetical protein [Nocardia huaxiensis]QLY32331.1 hypothetical protein H0264_08775 [Nocardia huaxiensis]UFS93963.1 hypothetical protein LPY97_24645 [Nocardia huaxiensis]
MKRVLLSALAAAALTGLAAAPAGAAPDPSNPETGSTAIDAGSGLLYAGSAAIVNPIVGNLIRSLCTMSTGDAICGLRDL